VDGGFVDDDGAVGSGAVALDPGTTGGGALGGEVGDSVAGSRRRSLGALRVGGVGAVLRFRAQPDEAAANG
jgi:hypothetical protein